MCGDTPEPHSFFNPMTSAICEQMEKIIIESNHGQRMGTGNGIDEAWKEASDRLQAVWVRQSKGLVPH